jgi:capsid protein
LGDNGEPIAIYVQKTHPNLTRIAPIIKWERIPIFAPDGQRNVCHACRRHRPDQYRGVGMAAPVILYLRMLSMATEAHVIAKRMQASYGLLIQTLDPVAAARADKNGAALGSSRNAGIKPGKYYYHNHQKVEPLNFNYQGTDFEMFRNPIIEAITAADGLPFEMVLKRLTKTNLAASRAALMTAYATARAHQNKQYNDFEAHVYESVIL